ncbi:hypothetical protein DFS33DRAFT_1082613 [Desarmillaria ectypa]|nr:hypothetical protein DFS33DRAFT_1082613 [Desarmillaria ectypa]
MAVSEAVTISGPDTTVFGRPDAPVIQFGIHVRSLSPHGAARLLAPRQELGWTFLSLPTMALLSGWSMPLSRPRRTRHPYPICCPIYLQVSCFVLFFHFHDISSVVSPVMHFYEARTLTGQKTIQKFYRYFWIPIKLQRPSSSNEDRLFLGNYALYKYYPADNHLLWLPLHAFSHVLKCLAPSSATVSSDARMVRSLPS